MTSGTGDLEGQRQPKRHPWALGSSWRLVMDAGQPTLVGPASEALEIFPRGNPAGAIIRYSEGTDRPVIVVPVVRCRALIGHTELTLPPPVLRPEFEGKPDDRIPLIRRQQDLIRRVVAPDANFGLPAQLAPASAISVSPPTRSDDPRKPQRGNSTRSGRYVAPTLVLLVLAALAALAWAFRHPIVRLVQGLG